MTFNQKQSQKHKYENVIQKSRTKYRNLIYKRTKFESISNY